MNIILLEWAKKLQEALNAYPLDESGKSKCKLVVLGTNEIVLVDNMIYGLDYRNYLSYRKYRLDNDINWFASNEDFLAEYTDSILYRFKFPVAIEV